MIGIVNVSSANYWEGMKQKIIAFICLVLWCGLRAYAQSPDVFQRDNIRMRMRQAAAWQLKNPQHELTDWTNGAFYAGLFAAYETEQDPQLLAALFQLFARHLRIVLQSQELGAHGTQLTGDRKSVV